MGVYKEKKCKRRKVEYEIFLVLYGPILQEKNELNRIVVYYR